MTAATKTAPAKPEPKSLTDDAALGGVKLVRKRKNGTLRQERDDQRDCRRSQGVHRNRPPQGYEPATGSGDRSRGASGQVGRVRDAGRHPRGR